MVETTKHNLTIDVAMEPHQSQDTGPSNRI